jgi:hypothetical protein
MQPPVPPIGAYPPAAPAAKPGTPKLVWVAVAAVLLVGVGVAAFFLLRGSPALSVLGGKGTARDRVMAAEKALTALVTGDAEALRKISSSKNGELLSELASQTGSLDTEITGVSWDGDVRVLSIGAADQSGVKVRMRADGDAVVIEVEQEGSPKTESMKLSMVFEGGRWVVDDFLLKDGSGWTSATEQVKAKDSGGSSGNTATDAKSRACFSNQRTIEGATQQYLAADPANTVGDVAGDVDASNKLIGASGYIKSVPACPLGSDPYVLDDEGATYCPYGDPPEGHGHYSTN